MNLVLDTNAYCLADAADDAALQALSQARHLFMPVIVYGELYYGFRHGTRLQENLRRLERFLESFDVQTIPVDLSVARKFGDLYATLRKKGRPIPTNDIWIGACCLSVDGTLLTTDGHFREVDGIDVQLIKD